MSKIYFKGLNGIRFIAAFLVILHHIEFLKSCYNFPHYDDLAFFQAGVQGVFCFFVLSGFLITYLLLEEERDMGKININNFYIRRILRIWPLYYLMVIIGLFIAPLFIPDSYFLKDWNKDFWERLGLYVIFLPNFSYVFYKFALYASHLWSIGVEEQFYVIWPVLLKKTRNVLMPTLIVIVFIFTFLKLVLLYINTHFFPSTAFTHLTSALITLKFNYMAIGAIGAVMYYQKERYQRILTIIFSKIIQCITYLLLIILLFYGFPEFYLNEIVTGSMFLIAILNVSLNPNSILKLENPVLNYLGKISYGIYVYHMIIIGICIKLWYFVFPINNSIVLFLLMYVCSIGLTILIATLSYKYLETPFLKLKDTRFATLSGSIEKTEINKK